jgi:FtsP/CotA-like multicopper oxidase with cupredoxin domain
VQNHPASAKEIIVSVQRRTLLRAIAGGAGFAGVQALFPAWAQTGSRGIAPTLATLSGPDIALTVGHSPFSIGDRTAHAVTVNGTLPAPLLRLREGQRARISVTNTLDEDTSIHWHGILLPFQMDGVPGIIFQESARRNFVYDFPASRHLLVPHHSGLQEAMGHSAR